MNQIPLALREELSNDPFYGTCALLGYTHTQCEGRITWEHALTYAGKQVQERFAIVPICAGYHLGPGLNKRRNKWVALSRLTPEDLAKYPKADWKRERLILIKLFGLWTEKKSSRSRRQLPPSSTD
jgi:hypothetical protein